MKVSAFFTTATGDFEKALKGENDGTESHIATLENRPITLEGLTPSRD